MIRERDKFTVMWVNGAARLLCISFHTPSTIGIVRNEWFMWIFTTLTTTAQAKEQLQLLHGWEEESAKPFNKRTDAGLRATQRMSSTGGSSAGSGGGGDGSISATRRKDVHGVLPAVISWSEREKQNTYEPMIVPNATAKAAPTMPPVPPLQHKSELA